MPYTGRVSFEACTLSKVLLCCWSTHGCKIYLGVLLVMKVGLSDKFVIMSQELS